MLNIYSPAKYGPEDIIIPDVLPCRADAVRSRGFSKTAISNLYNGRLTNLQKAKSNKKKNNDLFKFFFFISVTTVIISTHFLCELTFLG